MVKETDKSVTTVTFKTYYDPVVIEQLNKKTQYTRKCESSFPKVAANPTAFKNQLLLQGYEVVKRR